MPNRMMQFFSYRHLPEKLQATSRLFADVAGMIDTTLPENPEKTVALRKLLEAKDCAVRALLYEEPPQARPEPTSVPGPGVPRAP